MPSEANVARETRARAHFRHRKNALIVIGHSTELVLDYSTVTLRVTILISVGTDQYSPLGYRVPVVDRIIRILITYMNDAHPRM